MQDDLEKMDEIRRRTGVSYDEAHYALEEAEGDVAEAVAIAERDRETAGAGLAAAGMAFMDELKKAVSGGQIRAIRLKFGNRTLKEMLVSPGTAVAVLAVAAAAILITKLRVEVDREPEPEEEELPAAPGYELE